MRRVSQIYGLFRLFRIKFVKSPNDDGMENVMELEKIVTYEDFGAVGDGVSDDMPAIAAAHKYANEHRLPVRAKDGARYYIGGRDIRAYIKTSTNFGTAEFIIDDSVELEKRTAPLFIIDSEEDFYPVDIKRLDRGQKRLDLPHEGNLYIKVYDEGRRVYIRKGDNQNNGTAQFDCFTLDSEGNIGSTLPWQFDNVTKALAKSIDDEPIVIENGTFTTIANHDPREIYTYYGRNMVCRRSHTTMRNIKHLVTGEFEDCGSPYAGFYQIAECADVSLIDCVATPHRTYYWTMENGHINAYGTYDFNGSCAIDFRLIRLTQTIDIMDRRYWGLMGTNFCKDMVLTGCKISRFDAHCGVINMTMRDCEFGHVKMEVIGFGEGLIERCRLHGNFFMLLRGDYGSFFNGNFTIRDCEWEILPQNEKATFFNAHNTGDHDFGYECMLAENILIENLEIDDTAVPENYQGTYIFSLFDSNPGGDKPYPYKLPKTLTLRNVRTKSGREIEICENPELFAKVKIIKE